MSDEQGRRQLQASLSREIDAWLGGDTSRRSVLKGLLQVAGYTALSGPLLGAASALAQGASVEFVRGANGAVQWIRVTGRIARRVE